MQAIWYGTGPVAALGTHRDDEPRQRAGLLVSGQSVLEDFRSESDGVLKERGSSP